MSITDLQKNSWMTAKIFMDCYIDEFIQSVKLFIDKENGKQGLFIIKNSPTHSSLDKKKKY